MIFVTVGNATDPFRRLLEAMELLAASGQFQGEPVIIQCGHVIDFRPQYCKAESFFPPDQFARLMGEAAVVVCHGGAGSLHHAFQAAKVPVVMPRRRKYRETLDDQYELVRTLAREGRIIPAYEPEDLPEAIAAARGRKLAEVLPAPSMMLELVGQAVEELLGPKSEDSRFPDSQVKSGSAVGFDHRRP
jgi:UDP-N-acetylglucosamine transferase subunit ALG13